MAGQHTPLVDNEAEVLALIEAGYTYSAIGARFGVQAKTVTYFARKRGIGPRPGFGHTGAAARKRAAAKSSPGRQKPRVPVDPHPPEDSVEIVDEKQWGDVRRLLELRGLKQEEWVITGVRANTWGGIPDDTPPELVSIMRDSEQLRVDMVPKLDLILPARTEGYTFPKPAPRAISSEPKMVAFFGDQHAPLHDRGLHEAACQWLTEHQPDRLILVGDLMDYDAVSRHAADPENGASLQQCIDGGYALVRAYREAAPNAEITALDGNHEERLRAVILKQIASLYRLRPGVLPGEQEPQPLLSTRHLLRLDELHVEWIDPHGSYEHAQVKVSPELAARHGWIAKKGSGSSALATIDHLRHSCVIGHTHRQSIVHHTAHDIDGEPHTLLGAETGTMSQVRGGHGYAVAPDWQQGFATATVWPDGRFKLDLATYVDGTLLWRDWRCTP